MNPKNPFAKGNKLGCFKRSEITKEKIRQSKLGEKNPQWKGDKPVHKVALHVYARRRLPKPEFCESCKTNPPYDLANVTGIYSRDLKNWKYYCRRCHMLSDGRMKNLKQFRGDD
jgi:hypothetical protein